MTQTEVEAFITSLANVQQSENFGYTFFFVGDDHRLPFATIANSDSDYDNLSKLDRDGVFRVNIGVRKETFQSMFVETSPDAIDYTARNVFLPHPDYAKQYFVCILTPEGANEETTKNLIVEAHSVADEQLQRNTKLY